MNKLIRKTIAFFIVAILVVQTMEGLNVVSESTLYAQETFQDVWSLYDYWRGNECNNFPDNVGNVYEYMYTYRNNDSHHKKDRVAVIGLVNDTPEEEQKILSILKDQSHVVFTSCQYSYKELSAVKEEIEWFLSGKEVGYGIGITCLVEPGDDAEFPPQSFLPMRNYIEMTGIEYSLDESKSILKETYGNKISFESSTDVYFLPHFDLVYDWRYDKQGEWINDNPDTLPTKFVNIEPGVYKSDLTGIWLEFYAICPVDCDELFDSFVVEYATNPQFENKKQIQVSSDEVLESPNLLVSIDAEHYTRNFIYLSKIEKGKQYWLRIRAYNENNRLYSEYSETIKIKTTKAQYIKTANQLMGYELVSNNFKYFRLVDLDKDGVYEILIGNKKNKFDDIIVYNNGDIMQLFSRSDNPFGMTIRSTGIYTGVNLKKGTFIMYHNLGDYVQWETWKLSNSSKVKCIDHLFGWIDGTGGYDHNDISISKNKYKKILKKYRSQYKLLTLYKNNKKNRMKYAKKLIQ